MNSKLNLSKNKQEKAELFNQKLTDAMMAALKTVHSAASPDSTELEDLAFQRREQEVLGRLMSPTIGFSWETLSLGEMPMAWVRPERGHDCSIVTHVGQFSQLSYTFWKTVFR